MSRSDRTGLVQVKQGPRRLTSLSVLIGLPCEVVEAGISDLVDDGCLLEIEAGFFIRNFLDAQEATQSDAQRQRDSRERKRAGYSLEAQLSVTKRDALSQNVTKCHKLSQAVTSCHSSLAVPSLAVPLNNSVKFGAQTSLLSEVVTVASQSKERTATAKRIFEHWKSAMRSPRSTLDKARSRVIGKALTFATEAECLEAIDGCVASRWHMGANERGKKFNSLDLILRNRQKLEEFIETKKSPNVGREKYVRAEDNVHDDADMGKDLADRF